ncbi:MAG: S-layer homology domain-containing protein [Candidatus Margulisiibacteriota bacterium]
MRNQLIFIFILSFVILALPTHAQLGGLGINPFDIEIGSRPLGMGGAFAGLADDMNAAFYNPGGLAWAKGISLSLKDFGNISAVQAYPTGFGSSLGLAVITSKISNIPIPAGSANSNSNIISLSYGTKLTFLPGLYKRPFFQRLGLGLNIKGLMGQTLRRTDEPDRSATGWDMDVGVLWKGEEWWSAGVSLQNILPAKTLGGGIIKWDVGEEEGIPAVGKLSASARLIGDIGSPIFMEGRELLLGGELDFSRNRPMLLRLGAEWNFAKRYYFRTGFMQQYQKIGISSDINFGMGLRFERWGLDFVSYREPIQDERFFCASFLYFPKEWIVVRKLDVEKPAVMIERPIEMISLEDNIVTYDDKIEVFGKVKPGVEVYINGLRASLGPDNSFKTVVPLRLKKNLIVVEARYEGEKKVWKYKVLRKARVKIADEERVKDLEEKKEAVESLVTMGVIEITPEAEFVMEAGVTRGELSSWLVKASDMKLPEVKKDLFADVPKEHLLAPYIKVVTDLKLLLPFPDGTFRPGAVVSKEEGDAIFAKFGVAR